MNFGQSNPALVNQLKSMLVKLHAREIPGIWIGDVGEDNLIEYGLRWVIYLAVTDKGLGFRFSTVQLDKVNQNVIDTRADFFLLGEVVDEKESNLFKSVISRLKFLTRNYQAQTDDDDVQIEFWKNRISAVTEEEKETFLAACRDHVERAHPVADPLINKILSYRQIQNS